MSEKVILLILDGWGHREEELHNAVKLSKPENFMKLLSSTPSILIDASGESVGLPAGQMGNSEVGHMNLGAGRVVYQDLVRITKSIESGDAEKNTAYNNFLDEAKKRSGRLHFLGLLSDGGVHSHIEHFKAMMSLAHKKGIDEIFLHIVTDGRDTPPTSGLAYVKDIKCWMEATGTGLIADVCGRFYLMDRDKRWDRVEKAYRMLRGGDSSTTKFNNALQVIEDSYAAGITDEFIIPSVIDGANGTIRDGDSLFFMNFRADRMREIMSAFYLETFDGFERGKKPDVALLTLTEYDESLPVTAMYKKEGFVCILGDVIADAGLKQLRIAETEKYAHVTYFFNGGFEEPFKNEERILVPSPRDVPTYDKKPEMSVHEVARRFEERFAKGDLDFAVVNLANPDMVGHTGVEAAAVTACHHVDEALGKIMQIAEKTGAALLVTADHGNCEIMWDSEHNEPHTAHTTNPVWLSLYNHPASFSANSGKLADIAPTVLKLLAVKIPQEMTGNVLI